MAYNKSKHIDAAQKYLQQGKLPQAIAEYQQILKNEPKDQVTLMTLGDLFVRQGETFQALEYFERLAKIFLNDGFTTKAIAIYKKVAKLAPEESRPLERLAELYIQQGVLSEARPLYLQLAEVQLRSGKRPEAAALFRKLLEAEPDNLRVQVRLGELLIAMGQQKEAVEIFYSAAQRLLDHGDHAETIRMADRILKLDPQHLPTLTLKVRGLVGTGNRAEAAKLLESLPEQDMGSETTMMLVEQHVEDGQIEKAATLAEKVFAREPKNYTVAHHVAKALLESDDLDRAQALLGLIRNTMIDSGEHELLAQTILQLLERRPGQIEQLEWLVDLYGRANDSFRMPDALAQLANAHETAGDDAKALETYKQLLERTPEDETTRRACVKLREKLGIESVESEIYPAKLTPTEPEDKSGPPPPSEPALAEETQRYVTQVLTDVDLFSSYGLTQKAIDLLESALQRAPQHTPILERLLDLSVGAGNDPRTVELASTLEQIAIERKDNAGAERYAEFRRRFQRAVKTGAEDAAQSAALSADAPPEFAVPIIDAKLDETLPAAPAESKPAEQINAPMPTESVVHEVDLSDEWAALSQQLEEAMETSAPPEKESKPETPAEAPGFDLEPQPAAQEAASKQDSLSSDALLADLAKDFESATASLGIPEESPQHTAPTPAQPASSANTPPERPVPVTGAASGPLGDLFEEFRSEMSEINKDDEDIETHYNLGIAYREMGLLEEAISEFQKVAKASDKAPVFRYAMQCCTLLGLTFMEKGQPAIATIWYERALQTPGLDQESVLALRYDLGVAQELAGETSAAYKTFSQVYAMNIDYRDVSERIALLGKAR